MLAHDHQLCLFYSLFDRNLTKAAFILLPILGCTWIFGIIAVNEKLIAFAWIFTILNSLQVNSYIIISFNFMYYINMTVP